MFQKRWSVTIIKKVMIIQYSRVCGNSIKWGKKAFAGVENLVVVLWLWFLYHSWGKPFQSKLYHDSLSLFTIQEKKRWLGILLRSPTFSRWKRESFQGFITILKFPQRHPGISVIFAIWTLVWHNFTQNLTTVGGARIVLNG